MRLVRYGPPGHERPGIVAAAGVVRDLSAHITDINDETVAPETLEQLARLDPARLPGARRPAAAPPLLGLAAPITGAVLGWLILHQSLSPLQLAGFIVTIGAISYGASVGSSAAGAALVKSGERPAAGPARLDPVVL